MDIDDIYLAGKNAAYDIAAKKLLASRKILGNADSIAESDFIWIFIHSVVDILLHHRDTGSGSDACPSGSDECGEPYPW